MNTSSPEVEHIAEEKFNNKTDELNTTDDGESSQESQSPSKEAQLGFKLDLLVPFNLVEGGRVKIDLDQLQPRFGQVVSWEDIMVSSLDDSKTHQTKFRSWIH